MRDTFTTKITYQVRGRWPSPTDMLRYDDSEPVRALIEALSTEHGPVENSLFHDKHTVTLTTTSERHLLWEPTDARWRSSFTWMVVSGSVQSVDGEG